MTTRDYLIVLLQGAHALHRDVLPMLDNLRHQSTDGRVQLALQTQHDGLRGEMETAEQALNLLGARFTLEHSVPGRGLKEAGDRFRHQHAPTREQLDVHALLLALTAAGIARGMYQGAMGMAQAIGEQDVAKLLEEMDHRQVIGQADLGELIPRLLQEIEARGARRAA